MTKEIILREPLVAEFQYEEPRGKKSRSLKKKEMRIKKFGGAPMGVHADGGLKIKIKKKCFGPKSAPKASFGVKHAENHEESEKKKSKKKSPDQRPNGVSDPVLSRC